MKKLIAFVAALALCLTAVAGLAENANPALTSAASYVYALYKNPSRNDIKSTPADFDVVGIVPVNGVDYVVEWTADSDTIKITVNEDKSVHIDVDETASSELIYTLTFTVKDENGNAVSKSVQRKVPASLTGMSYAQIVDYAYTLLDGEKTPKAYRIYGTVTNIPSEWSDKYNNITVDMVVAGKEDMPIQAYRLTGEGAQNLKVGDQITVEGYLTRYKDTFEFASGCTLIGYGEIVSQQPILDAAYQLLDGEKMTTATALKGTIVKIPSVWSDEYGNITVDIIVDGKEDMPIECYRLTGEGAKDLQIGDEIAVCGTIKNYKGTVEFDKGCVLIPVGTENDVRTAISAYTLLDGEAKNAPCTLTGVIATIDTAYSAEYGNITVTIVMGGVEEYKVQCYRLTGEGAADLQVGDTITVTGTIKNYKGTIEFDKGCTLDAVVKAN